ncbi:hypothetical protein JKF63_00767 [Porcisia hertigi]|uniref:Uncharacterized protein n=1 Tax=Porcisia hertigi TaxID=2761500 RepID=A0A836I8U6_9TRYP|nr:hypothetical protein JKF63_00767 [Porcisia hertigi]
MPLPPVEAGPAGMKRRNFLVELNQLRVSQYAPTRKQLEEDDLRMATLRKEEKELKRQEWVQATRRSGSSKATCGADGRPLPGGGPRSMRASGKGQAAENTYKLEKEEEAAKKREYNRLYERDAKEQLALHEAAVKQMAEDEARQTEALRKINEDENRMVAELHAKEMEEDRKYMMRLKESYKRELAAKKAAQQARNASERELEALISENNRHRAEMDERQRKNVIRSLQLHNEEFHREAVKNKEYTAAKHYEEVAALEEHNRRLTKEEQEAAQRKKEQFRKDLKDCIERDKEFRRKHNYDEPKEVTRQRHELAAESNRLILQEERLRDAERRQQYRKDLMGQIAKKQEFRMMHLDEPGI